MKIKVLGKVNENLPDQNAGELTDKLHTSPKMITEAQWKDCLADLIKYDVKVSFLT